LTLDPEIRRMRERRGRRRWLEFADIMMEGSDGATIRLKCAAQ
jgi:hypothetical protein